MDASESFKHCFLPLRKHCDPGREPDEFEDLNVVLKHSRIGTELWMKNKGLNRVFCQPRVREHLICQRGDVDQEAKTRYQKKQLAHGE